MRSVLATLSFITVIASGCSSAEQTPSVGPGDVSIAPTPTTDATPETLLTTRPGSPPDVTDGVPHIQLDQTSPAEIVNQLVAAVYSIPNVVETESVSSLPGARGLTVASGVPARLGAMITGREFAHIHADPNGGGSLHMRLPSEVAELVVSTGWGTYHPYALDGSVPNYVMVFSPRDETDLVSVLAIVREAALYAMTPGDDPIPERPNVQGLAPLEDSLSNQSG